MLNEFKKFALRGNMLDLAIGIILGAGFSKIVASLVSDIIMPPIGLLLGKVNFSNLFINISGKAYASLADAKAAGAATINYGIFISVIIDFILAAFIIFLIIRQINRFNKPKDIPAAALTIKECPFCMSQINIKASRCPNCTSELK